LAIGMAMPLTTILVVKLSGGAASAEPVKKIALKKQKTMTEPTLLFIKGIPPLNIV
jgi:hypothetical protein